jgi:thiol:disulfide interchange protein DsbA
MGIRGLAILATVLLAACGAEPPPGGEPDAAPPAAADGGAQSADAVDAEAGAAAADVSARFQLNAHYTRLSPTQPTSSSPTSVEVAEMFWYGCPHCFTFDPLLAEWEERKPEYVSFVRIPAVWNPLLQLHARAYYAAEALGKSAEMHEPFFREIHVNGNALDTEEKLAAFFGRFGVDEATFKSTFDSFAVHTKVQRADELARRYMISSVPSIVVNGKYTTDATMTGSYESLIDLIDELVASERAGN